MKAIALFFTLLTIAIANPIEPKFDVNRDVHFLLSTRQNRNNPYTLLFRNQANLDASPFNPARPTRLLVHGWFEDDTADINVATSEELLNYYDFNVIFVDWSAGSQTINYAGAAGRVEAVGAFTAAQLNWMRDIGRLDFNRVHVIGFSLGAHIAGFVGKNTANQLNTLIGLDPAGPLFRERNPDGRINAGDAQYVECLHTNGALVGAGIGAHICDADFFPNGGESQPGCITNACAHGRAVLFYVESIENNGFHSVACTSVGQANRENCNSGGGVWFGNPNNQLFAIRGIFHFRTNRNSPFARGPFL